ncbi:MAG: CPBP family intramembrane metalloprotease [Gammaproteobacteria bacterium]|jgi:membrane protease YdiL (CAAX protease family)|nr:CPBP family intramembrane metalloprotease [Gammaproteobacteria bacterium]MBT7043783.1 CPBP family intramembrane metalloprotease [Gammaproteobacteria bacterium]
MISPLLMAPLFETSIVCYFLFRIYKKYNLQRWAIFRQWGFIIPSAVIFSLLHLIIPGAGYYRLGYTFIGGLLLAHLFLTTVKTHDINKAFWTTVLSHSFFNLFPFILSPIFM